MGPAGGRVVEVLDGLPDIDPGAITDPTRAGEIDPRTHPAGNHVLIETAAGEYLLIAHFRKGTITVAEGSVVTTGDVLGRVGSSGNSSEPHMHIHLQDGPDFFGAETIGLPLPFTGYIDDGELVERGMPRQGQVIAPAS